MQQICGWNQNGHCDVFDESSCPHARQTRSANEAQREVQRSNRMQPVPDGGSAAARPTEDEDVRMNGPDEREC